jgi:hypothetical protein
VLVVDCWRNEIDKYNVVIEHRPRFSFIINLSAWTTHLPLPVSPSRHFLLLRVRKAAAATSSILSSFDNGDSKQGPRRMQLLRR